MIWSLLIVLSVILSAIANAVADRLENHVAFNASIFYKLNPRLWLKEISWQYAKKVFGYKIDAWHLVESFQVVIMLFCIVATFLFEPPKINSHWWILVMFVVLGNLYNAIFNLFYHNILKRK